MKVWVRKNYFAFFTMCVAVGLTACGLVPQRVDYNDPRIQPMLAAMEKVDRAALGFTPVGTNAPIRLEIAKGAYDAMLHVGGETSRTIAFRKAGDGYRWIFEQEEHQGPGWRQTVDGTFRENIVVEYQTERVDGVPVNQVVIHYSEAGTNGMRRELTLAEAEAIFAKWKTTPVAPQPPDLPGAGFDPAPLMFVLSMLAGLAIGALVLLVLLGVSGGILSALLLGGIISSSVAFGILQRSVGGGFRALFLQLGALFGTIGGLCGAVVATIIRDGIWNSRVRWVVGAVMGLLFGLGCAWLFNFGWTQLAKYLTNRIGSGRAENRAR